MWKYSWQHTSFYFCIRFLFFIEDPISYPVVQTPQPSHRDHSIIPEDGDDFPDNNRIATPRSVTEMDDVGKETSLIVRDIPTPEGTDIDDSHTLLVEQVDFIP